MATWEWSCCEWLLQGGLKLVEVSGSSLLHGGERIYVLERVKGGAPLPLSQAPEVLQVVYEDDELACIIKPPGMPMEASPDPGASLPPAAHQPCCSSYCVCVWLIPIECLDARHNQTSGCSTLFQVHGPFRVFVNASLAAHNTRERIHARTCTHARTHTLVCACRC